MRWWFGVKVKPSKRGGLGPTFCHRRTAAPLSCLCSHLLSRSGFFFRFGSTSPLPERPRTSTAVLVRHDGHLASEPQIAD